MARSIYYRYAIIMDEVFGVGAYDTIKECRDRIEEVKNNDYDVNGRTIEHCFQVFYITYDGELGKEYKRL